MTTDDPGTPEEAAAPPGEAAGSGGAEPSPTAADAPEPGSLAERLGPDVAALEREIREIELLIGQARTEAERHEAKRAQAAEKQAQLPETAPPADAIALSGQLVTLTHRAALMQSQVEVLEGKRKTLSRFHAALADLAGGGGSVVGSGGAVAASPTSGGVAGSADAPGVSRMVLTAQEDLRREIARAMHDGPAQSLTNIVLQAQIVDRLLAKDPDRAREEVGQLVAMVQQTLEATKTFIFDVRPMVLDDLGLVPTLRRAARDRGRRAGIAVEFDSIGQDRRLSVDLESSLFRILDEALGGYLGAVPPPDRVALRLDWSDDRLVARLTAGRERTAAMDEADRDLAATGAQQPGKNTPAALVAMMEERREKAAATVAAAAEAAIVALPPTIWREIGQRAATQGIDVEQLAGGGEIRLAVDLTATGETSDGSTPDGASAAS